MDKTDEETGNVADGRSDSDKQEDETDIYQDLKMVVSQLCVEAYYKADEDEPLALAYIDNIFDRMTNQGYDSDQVEDALSKLCMNAELYELKKGYYGVV